MRIVPGAPVINPTGPELPVRKAAYCPGWMFREHFTSVWLPVGTALAGRYVLTGRLARGGVSHVYRAVDAVSARPHAIKTLSAHVPLALEGLPRMSRSEV